MNGEPLTMQSHKPVVLCAVRLGAERIEGHRKAQSDRES